MSEIIELLRGLVGLGLLMAYIAVMYAVVVHWNLDLWPGVAAGLGVAAVGLVPIMLLRVVGLPDDVGAAIDIVVYAAAAATLVTRRTRRTADLNAAARIEAEAWTSDLDTAWQDR